MLRSLLNRTLNVVILLGLISVLAFYLSKLVPGDEVLDYLSIDDPRYSGSSDPWEQRISYAAVAHRRGLDQPLFYFSLHPGYYPDSLFSITPANDRETVISWIKQSGDKDNSLSLYKAIISGLAYACPQSDTSPIASNYCSEFHSLLQLADRHAVHREITRIQQQSISNQGSHHDFHELITNMQASADALIKPSKKFSLAEYIPSFDWHGTKNQYHQWIAGFVTYQPLTSLVDGRNAWTKIFDALKWTLLLNGIAFLLAVIIGMGIGIWSGVKNGTWFERLIQIKLFLLFALPSFWLATLLIYFLSSGEWLKIFPSGGLGPYHMASNFFEKSGILLKHLILPVICLTVGSLAYVSRQMKQSVLHQFTQPYVLSLRAQGVSESTILRKHIVKNALFPMIT